MGNITIFVLVGAVVVALVACVKILLIFIAPSSKAASMRDPQEETLAALERREGAIKELRRRQAAARDPRHQSEQLVRQDPKGAADALRRMMKH